MVAHPPRPALHAAHPSRHSIYFCAILACVQATQITGAVDRPRPPPRVTPSPATSTPLIVFLHKNCNADLFEAVGALELSLTQIKLLHHLEDRRASSRLKEAAELVHVSMPAASRMVDDLVRRGFASAARTRTIAG